MNKPRILVLAAAGRTGMPVALQLLDEGFPVTALVHQADQRSERLKAKGADIVVGSLTDINDMRTAMAGARRAYFCVPYEEGNLKAATIFTVVAAEQPLEAVVAMSQWLSNPNHPAVHTRSLDGCQDQLLAPMQEGKAFCPACGHIGERQGIQETALSIFTTVGHQVRFQKAGTGLIPRLECTDRDLLLQERSGSALWRDRAGLLCAENAADDLLLLHSWKGVGYGTYPRSGGAHAAPALQVRWGERG
jgi:NAD(P)H-binding